MIRLYDEYCITPWQQRLFPYAGDVMKKRIGYLDTLAGKVADGDYTLITVIPGEDGTDRVLKLEDIEKGPYEHMGDIPLPVSRVNYTVQLWKRVDMTLTDSSMP